MAIYPLNGIERGKDIGPFKNPSAKLVNVVSKNGPDGLPAGSYQLQGFANSFIYFPNTGRLDTQRSITILLWLWPGKRGTDLSLHAEGHRRQPANDKPQSYPRGVCQSQSKDNQENFEEDTISSVELHCGYVWLSHWSCHDVAGFNSHNPEEYRKG